MSRTSRQSPVGFLKFAAPYIDAAGLLAIFFYTFSIFPDGILSSGPATGGDMGSHFWPLQALVDYGIPQGRLRMWNPGNLGGEPHFVQYFPLPYFVMLALSTFLPLGAAYNLGTLLPVFAYPFSIYFALRILKLPFPAPLLGAAFGELFLFNESYSMWGGNLLSLFSGQFAHAYALNLFIVAIALFAREFSADRLPYRGVITAVAIGLSHAYVFLGVPFLLATPLFSTASNWKRRILQAVFAGVAILLLLLWFIVPMMKNGPWTTEFNFHWSSGRIWAEAFPLHYLPFLLLGGISGIALFSRAGQVRKVAGYVSRALLVPALGFLIMYFVFPYFSLIDVRALPQISFLILILSGALFGLAIRRFFQASAVFLSVFAISATLWAVEQNAEQAPNWASWNYSGWPAKPLYDPLMQLTKDLKGSFSDPRVAYEQNIINHSAGTERVFEMLPYFSNRATMESVYHYASLLSPEAFHLQAEISSTPSCPFPQFDCPKPDLQRALTHASLLGVGSFILSGDVSKKLARATVGLTEGKTYGPWTLFHLEHQPSLVEVPRTTLYSASDDHWNGQFKVRQRVSKSQAAQLREVSKADWKERFYQWFAAYDGSVPYMFYSPDSDATQPISGMTRDCSASVEAVFNRITLHTTCPGRAHILKFAYHGDWQTNTGDPLFIVSPGFIGLIPTSTEVKLTFGGTPAWQISSFVSLVAAAIFFFMALRKI